MEGAFSQTTLERQKKVQEQKILLSLNAVNSFALHCILHEQSFQTCTQATLKDESEEVNRLAARTKQLKLVSFHTNTHTHKRICTHIHCNLCVLLHSHYSLYSLKPQLCMHMFKALNCLNCTVSLFSLQACLLSLLQDYLCQWVSN